jgi:hypothetical protein
MDSERSDTAADTAALRRPGRPKKEGFESKFLEHFAEWGNRSNAAKAAGVSATTVRKREMESPEFAQQIREAHEAFVEELEQDLVRLGRKSKNVIAIIARLKGERPAKYNDKLQVDGVMKTLNLNLGVPSQAEAAAMLKQWIAEDITDATREQLGLGPRPLVIDAPALSHTTQPATS